MKNLLYLVLIFLFQNSIFSQTPEAYVLGDFKQESIFTSYSNPGETKTHYLRKEVLEKLLELFQTYQRENPNEKQNRLSYPHSALLKIKREFGKKSIPEKEK